MTTILDRIDTFNILYSATERLLYGFKGPMLPYKESLDDLEKHDLLRLKDLPAWRDNYITKRLKSMPLVSRDEGISFAKMTAFRATTEKFAR